MNHALESTRMALGLNRNDFSTSMCTLTSFIEDVGRCFSYRHVRGALTAIRMILRADSSSWLSWLPYLSLGLLPLALVYKLASMTDAILLFSLTLFRNWKSTFRILQSYNPQPFLRIATDTAVTLAIAQIAKLFRKWPGAKTGSTDEGPNPLFFPSRTTHTRLFPKTHSFS